MKRRIKFLILLLLPISVLWVISNFYGLGINSTDSLPQSVFVIKKKGAVVESSTQYIAFKLSNNKRYGNTTFIKKVGGRAGEVITEDLMEYKINGRYVGKAKSFSREGEEVELTPSGVIPEGYYFVYSLHKDSYDSKYKEFGLVAESNIIGVAYPVF